MKNTSIYSVIVLIVCVLISTGFTSIPTEKPLALIGLQVTVLDEKGNVIEGAEVTLYANEDDAWDEENGMKAKDKTNKNGRVKFTKGLKEQAYYVVAKKGDQVSEDGLKSSKLSKNKMNKINVIISKSNGVSVPKVKE
ncbi:hypothetical protein [Flammeovirga kamogawensis]|uniref:Carboxypeptidase regulatory-like domain-containing protein n=1 Tax=Flammeovirga kamogawensis TaxID=373891 RepID=A0ABX8GTV0_9BACT|nr:hypothetical protein [Flammeovirga kamogawensis]MBB6459933.1 5-hydroxyisourate hydrolase-like protein (transthyretin family) [Flammeovirga kamogawensis]QWG07014.1 hypothetical protein KM029_17190 [Flammeovirga kamogawensis]TRX68835.1 hypothetical protein EO216_12175 [Flammeovirga kamogawensis]